MWLKNRFFDNACFVLGNQKILFSHLTCFTHLIMIIYCTETFFQRITKEYHSACKKSKNIKLSVSMLEANIIKIGLKKDSCNLLLFSFLFCTRNSLEK